MATNIIATTSPVIKIKSFQLHLVNKVYGQMFYTTDEGRIYVDTIDGARISDLSITVLQTESERLNINPSSYPGNEFYVVETNILFEYMNGSWRIKRGRVRRAVAQTYYPDGQLVRIYDDDVSNNGILGDGSVVVRDSNRTISGILSAEGQSLVVTSLVGNQINLSPSSISQGPGSLVLNSDLYRNNFNNQTALYNGDLYVFGEIHKVAPEKWNDRFRVVSTTTVIDSESCLKTGSYIEIGSVLDDEKIESVGLTLTEDRIVTTGSLTEGSRLAYGSTVNGVSTKPPYIFNLTESTSVPDFQSLTQGNIYIEDESLVIQEVRTVSLGSELFIDLSSINPLSSFSMIYVNGKPYKVLGETEVNASQYVLIKIVSESSFIIIKER